jgi:hypothetical protein
MSYLKLSPPGRSRSDDLWFFRPALLPTELPGEIKLETRRATFLTARIEGVEPSLFGFVDQCVIQLHHILKAESSGLEPQAVSSICLANSADRPIGLLSLKFDECYSPMGQVGFEPTMSETTVLQTACLTNLHTDP